ncbi:MAG: hypothetical protein KDD55_07755 [Bdellovibrionales bacterium]|nr:hypothetical protein [Bdellovibrionales bacterium]
MASIIPENSRAQLDVEPVELVPPRTFLSRVVRLREIVDHVRYLQDVPNSLPADKTSVRNTLLTRFTEGLPEGDLPIAREDFERTLKRVAHRIAHANLQDFFQEPEAVQGLVKQLVAEARLACELGYTQREVALSLHKMTLRDYTLLQDQYPKMIIERALTRPDPVAAAKEIEKRREEHKAWVMKRLGEDEEASIAHLVASKSYRLKEKPRERFYHAKRLYHRFQRDRAWFQKHLSEEFKNSARHLASRTFYLPASHRSRVLTDHTQVAEAMSTDPRVQKYKIQGELLQRSVGIARNPLVHAQQLLDAFEQEYREVQSLLPGSPDAVYRGLAIRASMTASSDHAEQIGVAHGREPIPITIPELVERYQRYLERHAQFPSINWLLALDMTLSSKPEERLLGHLDTFRGSLSLTGKGVSRVPLLAAIEDTFSHYPKNQRGFLRRGLLGRFTSLAPSQLQVFSEFRERVQQELSL